MAKYYYGGVLLPEIPVVEGYPYQVIFKQVTVSDGSISYGLYSTEQPLYGIKSTLYENVTTLAQTANVQYWKHSFTESLGWYNYSGASSAATNLVNVGDTGTGTEMYLFTPIWSNYDIHIDPTDGDEIFFTASEPVLYVPELVDPMYYNGVLLPKIPEDESKPYKYIVYMNMPAYNMERYVCIPTDSQLYVDVFDPILGLYPSNNGTTEMYDNIPGEGATWTKNEEQALTAGEVIIPLGTADGATYELIWSNVDVPNGAESTEIYLAASDPVPYEEKKYAINESTLKAIANAIRAKTGKTELIPPEDMPSEIDGISSGGAELNIHYGDTEPSDTSKLWVKCDEPSKVVVSPSVIASGNSSKVETATSKTTGAQMCGASVGKKIYLFGGGATSSYSNIIQVFDTETETIKTLSTVLPDAMYGGMAAAVGTNIYIFGGLNSSGAKNTIYKFNTETEELTTLDVTLSQAIRFGAGIVVIGNKIYVVCGATTAETTGYYNAQVLDVETETLTVTGSVCGTGYSYVTCCAIGTDIYVFGGMRGSYNYDSSITKFDTLTQKYTSLSVALPRTNGRMCTGVVGNKLYLIGGKYNSANIVVFDLETKTIETLSNTFVTSIYGAVSCTVGNTIYIVGGYATANSPYIYKYVVSMEVASDEMQIQSTLTNNLFNIINGDVSFLVGVANVYKGNSDGVGELVDAYLYKDGAWTQI